MATKAVTLKNSNDDTVYPVTDISLVNGGIFADTIAPVEAGEQVTTNMIADSAVTTAKIDDGAVTRAKYDWAAETEHSWTDGTYASGYKASSNQGFMQKIQACIMGGFLYIRWGASPTSGNFPAGTEVTIGSIPGIVDGIDVSNFSANSTTAKRIPRFYASGAGAAAGMFMLVGLDIKVCMATSCAWACGEAMLPINYDKSIS